MPSGTFTIDALRVAIGAGDREAVFVHHLIRGLRGCGIPHRRIFAARDITLSINREEDCSDTAPMESVNGTVKAECVYDEHFVTRKQGRRTTLSSSVTTMRAGTLRGDISHPYSSRD